MTDDIWMSVGGEFRTRLEAWSNFGFSGANDDVFLLYRAFLHTDIHIGEHWRAFLEGRFSGLTERDLPGGRRDALDADYGDIWNAFIEANYDIGNVNTTVRLGRQELQFGKERLISPLDWSNNRRIFEGATIRLRSDAQSWDATIFVTSPVITDRNEFNNHDRHRLFSGVYITKKLSGSHVQGIDIYFLALNGINSPAVDQDRYTLGGRVWGAIIENLTYDIESAYQFGNQDGANIVAYMITGDVTYRFVNGVWTPWVSAGGGYASGDGDPLDNRVETFNQLFPLGHAYLGFIDAVGRQNVIDLHMTGGAWPIAKILRLRGDVHFFWLDESSDALYNAGGGVLRAGTSGKNQVGTEIDLTMLWKINRHASVLIGYSHFFAGDVIQATGPSSDIDFFYSQFGFTF